MGVDAGLAEARPNPEHRDVTVRRLRHVLAAVHAITPLESRRDVEDLHAAVGIRLLRIVWHDSLPLAPTSTGAALPALRGARAAIIRRGGSGRRSTMRVRRAMHARGTDVRGS